MERIFNHYNSSIESLELDNAQQEILDNFYDFLDNVPFIRYMVNPLRPTAKDLPRDESGKIIVDVTKPHILEDMDYFRPSALHYIKYGTYTNLRPNPNPNSEFGKWIREETRRCFEGYVRPSDGEWVTGDYYFFLNYCPMLVSQKVDGTNKAIRTESFPSVWDGHYLMSHYLEQARNKGKQAAALSSRGRGKSYWGAGMLAKRFVLGVGKDGESRKRTSFILASDTSKLVAGDQTLDKFQYDIDFIKENMQWPSMRLTDALQKMQWKMGYVDLNTGTKKGTLNSVVGFSVVDEAKIRGSRGDLFLFEEAGCHLKGTKVLMNDSSIKNVEDIKVGDLLMGDDGTPRKVLELHNGIDDMYKITLSNGDIQIVNSKHLIYFKKYNWAKKSYTEYTLTPKEVMSIHNLNKGYYIPKSNKVSYKYKKVPFSPYLLGLWLRDGDKTRMAISNEDIEVLDWIENYCITNNLVYSKRFLTQSKRCYNINISSKNKVYKDFKSLNLPNNKHIPSIFKYNSEDVLLEILAGVIDTDGTLNRKRQYYEITQVYKNKNIIDDLRFICNVLGFRTSLTTRISSAVCKGAGNLNYRLRISGDIDKIPVRINRKKIVKKHTERNRNDWCNYTFKVEYWGKGKFYGFTTDKNHLFLLDDFTIVHNSFPKLLSTYNNLIPSVKEGDNVYGQIFLYGTSGDSDSDFQSMQEIMYNPEGYDVYGIDNVYDKEGFGKRKFTFFFPEYLNRAGCYDNNGNSEVTKALFEIISERVKVKYNSSDIRTILKTISDRPIVPQEAIMRVKGNFFPITDINNRIAQLDANPSEYDDVYIGKIIFNKDNKPEFQPTTDTPIRDFPLKNENTKGAIEIFKLPEKDANGNVFNNRYIAGLDPIDDDSSNDSLHSLMSLFVLDLWTDSVVCEYTGRLEFADDQYEIIRKILLFFNARCLYENNKKGIYAYFAKMNSLYLLEETPEFLKEKDMIKTVGIGNKAVGFSANKAVNDYADRCTRNWLMQPVTIISEVDGKEVESTVYKLYTVKNRAFLRECSLFNPDINVDRIRAFGALMLSREQHRIYNNGELKRNEDKVEKDYLGNDDYFTNNYDRRNSIK